MRSASSRLGYVVQKRAARSLSRDFWQQKNFRGKPADVSSALAKTEFPDESLQPIRKTRVPGGDGLHPAVNERSGLEHTDEDDDDGVAARSCAGFRCRVWT
jgi:hypothetical protein